MLNIKEMQIKNLSENKTLMAFAHENELEIAEHSLVN